MSEEDDHLPSSPAINALAQLLCTIILIQEIMRNLLQVGKMTVQERTPDGQEIRMSRIINLNDTPWVLSGTDTAAADLDNIFSADNGKGHQTAKFGVFFHGVLVVFLDVVGEVIDGNAVVFDVFHDELFGLGELGRGEGVGFTNDRNNINTGGKTSHEFDVEFTEAEKSQLVQFSFHG